MDARSPAITVFTPAYNRAHTLPRLYASLRAQTFHDFDWLIVDDGSNDDTADLVARWASDSPFPIHYFCQPHMGKHVAVERASRLATAPLVATIDSDDEALPNTLEFYNREWEAIPLAQREGFSGVSGLAMDDHGALIGTVYPSSPLDSDLNEIRYRWRVTGDKYGCFRREVLGAFADLAAFDLPYISEGIVWARVARRYRHRFFNQFTTRVYIHAGAGNQITRQSPARNAPGMALLHRHRLNEDLDWLGSDPATFLRSAVHYARFSFLSGSGPLQQWAGLNGALARSLWLAAVGPGWLTSLRDRLRAARRT